METRTSAATARRLDLERLTDAGALFADPAGYVTVWLPVELWRTLGRPRQVEANYAPVAA